MLSPKLEKEYARDGVGNVTSITTDGGTPLAREFNRQNRLTDHGNDTLGFDAVGNLLTDDQSNSYSYDAWNRLVGFNEETDRYAYDAMNRRTKVGDRRLYHATNGTVIEEHDGDGLRYQHAWSLRGKHHALARWDYTGAEVVVLYAITDIYGTVTAITNVTGVVQERFVYDAQGNFVVWDGDWRGGYSVSSYDWATGWNGGRWDVMSELAFFNEITIMARLGYLIYNPTEPPMTPISPGEQKIIDDECNALHSSYLEYLRLAKKALDKLESFEHELMDLEIRWPQEMKDIHSRLAYARNMVNSLEFLLEYELSPERGPIGPRQRRIVELERELFRWREENRKIEGELDGAIRWYHSERARLLVDIDKAKKDYRLYKGWADAVYQAYLKCLKKKTK